MIIKSETNDFSVVREVMNDTPLLSLRLKWSFSNWCWMFVFEFDNYFLYYKAYDPI